MKATARAVRGLPGRCAALAFALSIAGAAAMDGNGNLAGGRDPFGTRGLVAATPEGSVHGTEGSPCAEIDAELSLADVVSRALCNNPQTRLAWANALAQAAQVGIARSAFLPQVNGQVSLERLRARNATLAGGTTSSNEFSGQLEAALVLFDFGARDASFDQALEALSAANHSQDATLQKVVLAAVQAYYQLFGARAAVDSTRQAERSAEEAFRAAAARYSAGSATSADQLLAKTAYSQAMLNRVQAEGAAIVAEGSLANVMGSDADHRYRFATPRVDPPQSGFESDLTKLIAAARENRPDLAAAQAQVQAAAANVRLARASGMPTVSLVAQGAYTDTNLAPAVTSQNIGIQLSIPIFTGFSTTYRIRGAQAQLESQLAQRDSVSSQVALDVWQAYYNLQTGTQSVRTTADLVASAQAAERVALGRYKAGAGTIVDTLVAESSLANARLQDIQARYSWYVLRAALAQALGQLDPQAAALDDTHARPR